MTTTPSKPPTAEEPARVPLARLAGPRSSRGLERIVVRSGRRAQFTSSI